MGSAAIRDTVVIVGVCVLGTWLLKLVREAAARADPPPAMHVASVDDLPFTPGQPHETARVLAVAGPNRVLMDAILTGTLPVLAAIDDPVDSIRFGTAAHGWSFHHGMTEQTRYAAGNDGLRANPAAMLVRRGSTEPAHVIIATIVGHLGLTLPPGGLQHLQEQFGGPLEEGWSLETALSRHVEHYLPLAAMADTVQQAEATMIREALSPLVGNAVAATASPVVWSREVFRFGDNHGQPMPAVADATGGSRAMFFGPYLHLPAGRWTVRLLIAFSATLAGVPFRVRMLCGPNPIRDFVIRPATAGAYECKFVIDHQTPETWLEVQFINAEGIIDGHISLGRMDFTR